MNRRLKVFTWHIHGTYLYYLSQGNYDIYIPVDHEGGDGYAGRGKTFQFGKNVIEIPAEEVKNSDFDLIVFQSHKNYLSDQYQILSEQQRRLPRICIEHDPPLKSPTDTRHPVDDREVLVVHVSYYNQLMWLNAGPTKVIEHGVTGQQIPYTGELNKGIVVINHLEERGRRLGADIFRYVHEKIPLDLIGMGTEQYGGLGEILYHNTAAYISRYRFFFNPIRYTSLGLAFLEAMRGGVPVVCLATTEYASVIHNGINGYADSNVDKLIENMQTLLDHGEHAIEIGQRGQATVDARFNIGRFIADWEKTFHQQIKKSKTYETIHCADQ